METCYALLGIAPTAPTEEIEEAYQRKKKEAEGDVSRQQELDSAYNEAIMATFAPIQAFSSPLPPLTTGKKIPPIKQPAPVIQPPPAVQSTYRSPEQEPAGETPMHFTDAELIKMDVSELRENYISQLQDENDDAEVFFLGIENKLLCFYVKTYIVMVIFDVIMRLWVGPGWLTLTGIPNPDQMSASTPAFLSVLFTFISIVYCFVCVLPMPFAARFFILGQPPDKRSVLWGLFSLGIICAFLLRRLGGLLLPLNVTGSAISFTIAAMALCLGTLRYNEN